MAILTQLDIREAIRDILTARHELTDTTRIDAVRQVRHYCEDNVFAARAPQGEPNHYILIALPGVDRHYHLAGEMPCATSQLSVGCFSNDERTTTLLWDGVRVALTGFVGGVIMQTGTLQIRGLFVDDEGEQDPEDRFDATPDFVHSYIGTFRINHDQTVPTGLN